MKSFQLIRLCTEQLRKKISELLKIPEHEQNFLNWRDKSYDDRVFFRRKFTNFHFNKNLHLDSSQRFTFPSRKYNSFISNEQRHSEVKTIL